MIIDRLKTLIKKIAITVASLLLYLPIIGGILAPMVLIIGIDLYVSWLFIGYNSTDWTWAYYIIDPVLLPFLISAEFLIFCFGLGLFIFGFVAIVKSKKEGSALSQTGIYKYIRHPQNLGIILMVFPFVLYIPGFGDLGIRMGEIASWMMFTFILCLYSYYEEWRLARKYKETYLQYYKATGFFIPKFSRPNEESILEIKFLRKILKGVVIFTIFFIVFFVTVQLVKKELMFYR